MIGPLPHFWRGVTSDERNIDHPVSPRADDLEVPRTLSSDTFPPLNVTGTELARNGRIQLTGSPPGGRALPDPGFEGATIARFPPD